MNDEKFLVQRFETYRTHLRGVAFRLLGSASEADDAVQEAWLRLSRSDISAVKNLGGWLTTVVAHVCLDMLRLRKSRREEPLPADGRHWATRPARGRDPEQEAILAESIGIALLVVLETLTPAERIAFVLHDMFDLPFEEIAPIVGRSSMAARQLASRARRRVRGAPTVPNADLTRQRQVIESFLAASRTGDFDALITLLDPDVVLHADRAATPSRRPVELRGATTVARQALAYGRNVQFAQPALINGAVGILVAPGGHLSIVLGFKFKDGRIVEFNVIADPARLGALSLAVLEG